MKTPEQIKQDFEQNHYRKQRELIDAGKLDYWGLSEKNQFGIINQCKEEAEKYPELMWEVTDSSNDDNPVVGPGHEWSFCRPTLYYSRIDPLPTEEQDTTEIELIMVQDQKDKLNATIKLLEKDLKEKEKFVHSTLDDLRKEKQLRSRVEENAARLSKEKYAIQEFVDSAAGDVEKYKGDVIKLEEDLKGLEEKLSQQTTLAKSATDTSTSRLNQIHELNKELQKLYDTLEGRDILIENYRKEEASLYRDIRTLAMKLA
jgi:DNA repair ATPase RecN